MRNRSLVVVLVVVAVAWIGLRVSVYATSPVLEYPDSASYLAKAAEPLWTSDFFLGSGRFFVVPLFYKMVSAVHGPVSPTHRLRPAAAPDNAALGHAQLALSLCAWLTLAWVLAARMNRGWLSVAAFTAVLLFGLSTDVIQWDVLILSESVSSSLFVLLVAMWIRLSDGMTGERLASALVAAAAWSMSREANSLLILPLAVAIALWGLWYGRGHGRERIQSGILAAALVAIFVATSAISGSGDRWIFPLLNVIGKRVLPSQDRTAFYQARGMPVSPTLMDMSGEFASGKGWAFYEAPELETFRAWLRADGRAVFAQDLVFHPVRTLVEPLQDVQEFVCPALAPYQPDRFEPLFPALDNAWVCTPKTARTVVAGTLVGGMALLAGAFFLRRRLRSSDGFRLLTVGAMLVGWLPFAWFTWHVIGGMENGRHEWSGVLMWRMAALLLLVSLVEAAANRRLSLRSS